MRDNRKSFTPRDMLTSGGNGDIGCATPFGYVTAKYQGGDIVCVTVDGDRFVPGSGQGSEPSGVWQFYQDGEWHVGMNRHNHRENTEAAGLPTRDLYTRPQPQGDGWIRCEDRLPTEADADEYGEVWVHDKGMTLPRYKVSRWKWVSVKKIPDLTHWMPTGLKRPQPPRQEGDQ